MKYSEFTEQYISVTPALGHRFPPLTKEGVWMIAIGKPDHDPMKDKEGVDFYKSPSFEKLSAAIAGAKKLATKENKSAIYILP